MKTALTTIADKQCVRRKNEPIRLNLFDTSQKLSEFLSQFALSVAAHASYEFRHVQDRGDGNRKTREVQPTDGNNNTAIYCQFQMTIKRTFQCRSALHLDRFI